jgi:CRP-like cAMP-binding protein
MLFSPTPGRVRRMLDLPLFAGCPTRDLRRIDTLSTEANRHAAHVLCRQGDIGRECFVLVDGSVDINRNNRHYTATRGAVLGEIALLSPLGRRTATLTALTDITMLVFSRPEFTQVMTGLPTVAHRVLREAARRLIENMQPAPACRNSAHNKSLEDARRATTSLNRPHTSHLPGST